MYIVKYTETENYNTEHQEYSSLNNAREAARKVVEKGYTGVAIYTKIYDVTPSASFTPTKEGDND